MQKRLKVAAVGVLVFASFLFGVVVATYHLFPFDQMRHAYRLVRSAFGTSPKADVNGVEEEDRVYGRWHTVRKTDDIRDFEREESLRIADHPYLQGYNPAPQKQGVTIHDKALAYPGLNLFCSGHAPEVYLMTMDGDIVHEWGIRHEQVWPDFVPPGQPEYDKQYVRRAYLFPNGDLLVLFEYSGLIKLDRRSRVLWSHLGQNHHDFDVGERGEIFALGRQHRDLKEMQEHYPDIPVKGPVLDDYVEILTSGGEVIKRFSLFDAFYDSDYAAYLDFMGAAGDVFHTNTIDIVDAAVAQKSPLVEEGNILISVRNMNTIAVVDLEDETVMWALTGMWRWQHQSVFLPNGNILLLDNHAGNSESFFSFNRSRVIELDPLTQKIVWQYEGTENDVFFTSLMGYNQRLPNGNTFITESNQGRMFEVTPDKRIVWEYYSPFRAGENGELIATLMGGMRLSRADLEFLDK